MSEVRRALVAAVQHGGLAGLVATVDELRRAYAGPEEDDDPDDFDPSDLNAPLRDQ